MKKIGQGLQFNVYSKGNKVIKKPTSKFQMSLKLIKWKPILFLKPITLKNEINKSVLNRKKSIKNIKRSKINLELLGNPIFYENIIEQDKVEVFGLYLKKDYEEAKIWIDKFIELIFECWKNGFSVRVFNLTINNGVDKNENVIFTDIGELTFEKKDVEKTIKLKIWEESWSFKRDMEKEIKDYYQEEMNKKITLTNLNKYWNLNKN